MNKKSQQGIALLWIIFASVLLITSVGLAFSKKQAQKIKESQQVSQPDGLKKEEDEKGEEFVGKIKEAIAKGIPMKCTYAQEGFTGVSFIKGNKIYSEVIQDGESGYVLTKDNCMWSWGWGSYQGTKMCFEGNIWDMSETMPVEAEYHCLPAVFPDSQFDAPANIDFMDIAETSPRDEELLKILPAKERAELENAIRETQQVLKSIEVFNFTPPSIDDINKGFDQINKQAIEKIQKDMEKQQQEFQQKYQQEIDIDKMMERLNQNPPAVSHEGEQLPPEAQEYYYRKYILKDPAFQY